MHTDKDFTTAICECPTDDHLRLIYADWLDEQDRHDRAEYIREEVLTMPNIYHNFHPDRPSFHPDYLPELALLRKGYWTRMTYNRGFLHSIELPSDAFLEHYRTLFEHPIQEVRLSDCYPRGDNWQPDHAPACWQKRSTTQRAYPTDWRERRYSVPDEIFSRMIKRDWEPNSWLDQYRSTPSPNTYPPDVETGFKWLSDACVSWARIKVGLPVLV